MNLKALTFNIVWTHSERFSSFIQSPIHQLISLSWTKSFKLEKNLDSIMKILIIFFQVKWFLPYHILICFERLKDLKNNRWYGFLLLEVLLPRASSFIDLKLVNCWQSLKNFKLNMIKDSKKFRKSWANSKKCKRCMKFTGTNSYIASHEENQVMHTLMTRIWIMKAAKIK